MFVQKSDNILTFLLLKYEKFSILQKRQDPVLSHRVLWCPVSELNQGHANFQSAALPTELTGLMWWALRDLNPGPAGYEPDALTN